MISSSPEINEETELPYLPNVMLYKACIEKGGTLTIKRKQGIMMTIIDRLRLAKLDPKHRKLSKYELEDSHQKPTALAREMLLEDFFTEAWASKRGEYIASLEVMEKQEKAEKSNKSAS